MVTRREFIQASALLGGAAMGGNSFGPLRFPGKDSTVINPIVTTAPGKLLGRYTNGVYSFKGILTVPPLKVDSVSGRLCLRSPGGGTGCVRGWTAGAAGSRLWRILGRPFGAREDERRLSGAQCLDTKSACQEEKAGDGLAPRRRLRSRFWRSGPL